MTLSASAAVEDVAAVRCELAGEALRSFGPLCFPASGWSMVPAVWPGDTFVVEPVIPERVGIGDVVVVGRQGKLCAHRVVSISGNAENPQWITQGDALADPDLPVSRSELMGCVAYLIRGGRCIPISTKLTAGSRFVGKILRGSVPAARVLVYLHGMVRTPEKLVG